MTGFKQDHLEQVQCRVCGLEVPLLDGITKKSRNRVRMDDTYKPMCRNCAYKQGTKVMSNTVEVDGDVSVGTYSEDNPEMVETNVEVHPV